MTHFWQNPFRYFPRGGYGTPAVGKHVRIQLGQTHEHGIIVRSIDPVRWLIRRDDDSTVVLRVDELRVENPTEMWPFKRRSKIGPGPLKQILRETGDWDCRCRKYKCVCEGISGETEGRTKRFRIDPKRKAEYNELYRKWLKHKRRRRAA